MDELVIVIRDGELDSVYSSVAQKIIKIQVINMDTEDEEFAETLNNELKNIQKNYTRIN